MASHRVVTKSELLPSVWPGTIVTHSALTRSVMKARTDLQGAATGRSLIATIAKEGYRFDPGDLPVERVGPDTSAALQATGSAADSDVDRRGQIRPNAAPERKAIPDAYFLAFAAIRQRNTSLRVFSR